MKNKYNNSCKIPIKVFQIIATFNALNLKISYEVYDKYYKMIEYEDYMIDLDIYTIYYNSRKPETIDIKGCTTFSI